jgi:PAS domain S-box-containing protein
LPDFLNEEIEFAKHVADSQPEEPPGRSGDREGIGQVARLIPFIQEAFRNREFAAFAQTAAIGLHWVGPDGRILWANKAELEMLGYREDEYVGHHISEFHEDSELAYELVERLIRGEEIRGVEARLKCRDGSVKTALIDSSGLWENGRFVHSQCLTRDFTEHKRLEESLRRKEAELRIQDRGFAATARDELASYRNLRSRGDAARSPRCCAGGSRHRTWVCFPSLVRIVMDSKWESARDSQKSSYSRSSLSRRA